MTIQQIVTVPADRRISLELPETVPTGNARIKLTLNTFGRSYVIDRVLHPFQSYRSASWKKLLAQLKVEREKEGPLFGGIDGLEYQGKIRDEWESRI